MTRLTVAQLFFLGANSGSIFLSTFVRESLSISFISTTPSLLSQFDSNKGKLLMADQVTADHTLFHSHFHHHHIIILVIIILILTQVCPKVKPPQCLLSEPPQSKVSLVQNLSNWCRQWWWCIISKAISTYIVISFSTANFYQFRER